MTFLAVTTADRWDPLAESLAAPIPLSPITGRPELLAPMLGEPLSADPFLRRFLAILEPALWPVVEVLDSFAAYLDPYTTNEEFLRWLASWLDATLDETWDMDRKRRLVASAVVLYRWRGTRRGMIEYLTGVPWYGAGRRRRRRPGGGGRRAHHGRCRDGTLVSGRRGRPGQRGGARPTACYRGTREAGACRLSDRGADEEGQVLTTRQCPDCGLANEATRRFCKSCGAMLPIVGSSSSGDEAASDTVVTAAPPPPAAAPPTPAAVVAPATPSRLLHRPHRRPPRAPASEAPVVPPPPPPAPAAAPPPPPPTCPRSEAGRAGRARAPPVAAAPPPPPPAPRGTPPLAPKAGKGGKKDTKAADAPSAPEASEPAASAARG